MKQYKHYAKPHGTIGDGMRADSDWIDALEIEIGILREIAEPHIRKESENRILLTRDQEYYYFENPEEEE